MRASVCVPLLVVVGYVGGMIVLWSAVAVACDISLFSVIPLPAIPAGESRGFGWARTSFRGADLVGGRVTTLSRYTLAEWKKVLLDPGRQDEWQAERFGNALTEIIDSSHLYMQVDVGLLFGAYHIRKQVVAEFHNYERPSGYRSCWEVIDPTPYLGAVARWQNNTEWERDTYGCWDLATQPDGTTQVSYQWWTAASAIPSAVQNYVLSNTLPDMVAAFDAEVKRVAGR